jgi:hypothetical protein
MAHALVLTMVNSIALCSYFYSNVASLDWGVLVKPEQMAKEHSTSVEEAMAEELKAEALASLMLDSVEYEMAKTADPFQMYCLLIYIGFSNVSPIILLNFLLFFFIIFIFLLNNFRYVISTYMSEITFESY